MPKAGCLLYTKSNDIETNFCIELCPYSIGYLGNGNCEWNLNIKECTYDGGDCCSSLWYNTSQINDGICDDDTNNKECRWDGNDCCGTNTTDVDTTRCIECTCYQGRYYCSLFSNAAFF